MNAVNHNNVVIFDDRGIPSIMCRFVRPKDGITITICRALRTLTATFGSGPVDYALWTEKFRLSLMVTL